VPAQIVYLEAYYPRTSLGFLIPSLLLFGVLAVVAWLTLWPVAIPFALVTLYLLRYTLRQARGPDLALRITDAEIYYRGWEAGLLRKGLAGGALPIDAIGDVELVTVRTRAGISPVIALWLGDPGRYRLGRGVAQFFGQMRGAGDLTIDCDEIDQNAEQVKQALDWALGDHIAAQGNRADCLPAAS
jgi:hypothetical protein